MHSAQGKYESWRSSLNWSSATETARSKGAEQQQDTSLAQNLEILRFLLKQIL